MHLLFIHQNFPAQFGHIAAHLAKNGDRCTFVSAQPAQKVAGIEVLQYVQKSGARETNHYCTRTFENQVWSSHALYETLSQRPDIQPDLIVAHSGYVSPLFLRELYPRTPQIGYFEFFYHAHNSEMDFRDDLHQHSQLDYMRCRARNAQLLLDLHNCDAAYSPTEFQKSTFPIEFQPKIRAIFDGIDTSLWKRDGNPPRKYGDLLLPLGGKIVTYVSRGFESKRGFDIFLQTADRICRARPDVHVVVVGEDRVVYGSDASFTGGKTFKEWCVAKYKPDLSRIHFIGRLPPPQLSQLLSLSDLHIYLTAPFVLSWSLLNSMSCGCPILASDTAPVREVIQEGQTGLLADFFNVEQFTEKALHALESPDHSRQLGANARELIEKKYSQPVCLAQLEELFRQTVAQGTEK